MYSSCAAYACIGNEHNAISWQYSMYFKYAVGGLKNLLLVLSQSGEAAIKNESMYGSCAAYACVGNDHNAINWQYSMDLN